MLTNLFGKSYFMIIFIFTLFGWTGLARVVRSQVLVLKNSNYVRALDRFIRGLKISSIARPMRMKENTDRKMPMPGAMIHHQCPNSSALSSFSPSSAGRA